MINTPTHIHLFNAPTLLSDLSFLFHRFLLPFPSPWQMDSLSLTITKIQTVIPISRPGITYRLFGSIKVITHRNPKPLLLISSYRFHFPMDTLKTIHQRPSTCFLAVVPITKLSIPQVYTSLTLITFPFLKNSAVPLPAVGRLYFTDFSKTT